MDDQRTLRSFTDTASATCVGRYTYRPATDAWTWSDGIYRIHGFETGDVVPTTALVMRHMHPDDVDSAHATRDAAIADGQSFTFPHRIRTAAGEERVVIAVGHLDQDDEGPLLVGHLVDVTEFRRDAVKAELDQAVQDFAAHRSQIEQAKGVLMQLYAVDADTAWHMLRAYSQDRDRKVRDLAETLVEAATASATPTRDQRGTVHEVLDRLIEDG